MSVVKENPIIVYLLMLWHLKADGDVQLLQKSISKKLNCDSLKKVVPRSNLYSKKHLIQLFQLTLSDCYQAKRQDRNVLWDYFFMNNFIKIIPARAGHCSANYNLLFSPGMTDFDEFIHKNPT